MGLFSFREGPSIRALRQCQLKMEALPLATIPGAPLGLAVEARNGSSRALPGMRSLGSRLLTLGARIKQAGDGAWQEVPTRGFLDADLLPGASMLVGLRMDAPSLGDYVVKVSLVLEGVAWQSDVAPTAVIETPLRVSPPGQATVVNLGSGTKPLTGAINLDRVSLPGVDVQADLDVLPWPFADGQFEEVIAFDVFEHVEDPLAFMSEAYRILCPAGLLKLHTSYWRTANSFRDPTHRRFCTPNTFNYWVPGTSEHQGYPHYSGGSHFAKRVVAIDGEELYFELQKASV